MLLFFKNHFNYFSARYQRSRGFTLIELLVAISIFSLLSSFLVVNYRDNEKARTLRNQAQEVVAGLQKVQNMALTGEEVDSRTPLSYRFSIADCAINCSYKLIAIFSDDPTNVEFSERTLKSVAIAIKQPIGSADLIVDFSPPRGQMAVSPDNPATAALEISNDEAVYCLKLNTVSGRIDQVFGDCQ